MGSRRKSAVAQPSISVMHTTAYNHLDSVSLSPDGGELWLDYSDWHEQHSTVRSRYIIPRDSQPRLVTDGSERQIDFVDIPKHLIRDAQAWLVSNVEAARSQQRDTLAMILGGHLEHLKGHQNDA